MEMNRQGIKNRLSRLVSIYITAALIFCGLFVFNPFEFPVITKNASAATMTVFFEDFDSSQGPLPWTGSSGTWTDRVNYPSGWGTSTWQVVAEPSAPSGPNCLYSGPEQQGGNVGGVFGWYYGTCTNAETPAIDLKNASTATLTFMHMYNFPGTSYNGGDGGTGDAFGDGGMVFISTDNGITWEYIEPVEKYSGYVGGQPTWVIIGNFVYGGMNPYEPFGDHDELINVGVGTQLLLAEEGGGAYVNNSGGWVPATFDLSDYAGYDVIISFRYTQNYVDQAGTDTWWFVDDVKVDKELIDGPSITVVGSDSQIVDQGQTYSYILNITNWKDAADWIDLNLFSTLGWTIELLNYTTYAPLTDDGGIGGLVDIGWLGPNQWVWIRVNVTVPIDEDWNVEEITYITATSFLDPTKSSSEELFTSTPNPDVGVMWITVPPDRPPGNSIDITARIYNYGDITVTFYVQCMVEGDLLIQPTVYNSTGDPSQFNYVANLLPGFWIDLTWNFTPEIASPYTITVTTLLDIDQNLDNNESSGICYVQSSFWKWNDIPDGDDGSGFVTWTNVATAWEWGTPPLAPGPGAAFEGSNCWGTDLDANYVDGVHAVLHTPWFNFTDATTVSVTFYHWYETDDQGGQNNRDRVYFGYNLPADGDNAINILNVGPEVDGGWEGGPQGWDPITIAVGVAEGNPQIRFSWLMKDRGAPSGGGHAGYYIDNISIYASIPEADLIITEIVDNDGTGNEYIEVYNQGNANATLGDYEISLDGGTTWITGTWYNESGPITMLENGKYAWFVPSGVDVLDDEGSSIMLVNTSLPGGQGYIHDDIGYGQKGLVPDPVTGESVARWWNGVVYTDDWTREITTSIGYPHTGNRTVFNPLVVLNEVYFNVDTGEAFIELIYVGGAGDPDVDIAGWVVVIDDNPYTIPAGPWSTILNSTHKLYVINATMAPSLFAEMTVGGDNVYLYNSTGSLVDMVGWNDPHTPGTAIARVPDGYGITEGFETYARDGYDDPTSIEAGWQFVANATMGIINLVEDQTKVGDLGETIEYILTLTNDAYGDVIDLLNETFGEGWVVELYGPDGITKLTDSNFNGIPDTGVLGPLGPNQIINITVKITIPSQKAGSYMDTVITAVPAHNQDGLDTVTLRTETYPHIEVDKWASPTEIWVNGSAASYVPQETTVTLTVWGSGLEQFLQFPQDVVFVIDKSGSMQNNDPDPAGPERPARVEAAWDYVDNMSVPDRGSVVKFSDNAILVDGPDDVAPFGDDEHTVWDLSSQYADIKQNIDECGDASGGTSMGFGLEIAVDQLIANGNSSHIQVIIALTDGETWDATRAYEAAKTASDNGIRIYTIGLGNGFFDTGLPIWFLEHFIANTTGGKYYPAATPDALYGIYAQIGQEINEIAGKQITVGTEQYLVRDVLPPGISYVPGTFTIPPDNITVNATGYTWLQWGKQYITINETWTCSFKIRSDLVGYVETNDYENSRVNYSNWNNVTIKENFPHTYISVLSPMPNPPELHIYNNGTNVVLDWTPPAYPDIDHFLIYRSTSRDNFDFSTPWVDTNTTLDPIGTDTIPDRTTWNDTGPLSPECYYIIRTVNSEGAVSFTSNTVGVYEKAFLAGVSSFSLPFEPCYQRNVSWYIQQIGSSPTDYLRWMDPTTRTWVKHYYSDGDGVNDTVMKVGEGYEIYIANPITYTFWGKPACSIRYLEGQMARPGNFAVTVNAGDVYLSWDVVPGADHYIIYRATTREGLNNRMLAFSAEPTTFGIDAWIDPDPKTNIGGNEFYYAVGAVNASTVHTCYNTTYSIGVCIAEYPAGYSAFGLPVKTFDSDTKTIDEYCDDIPNTVGINYHIYSEQRWSWHRFNMPLGAFDEVLGYTNGYQISVDILTARYDYIGR